MKNQKSYCGGNLSKLRQLIADFLADEKCYNLESVCDKHKLEESSKQLEPCSNKRKYVLSRISSEDNDFLLNLAIQLLESLYRTLSIKHS